jgi:hypothetical protein
VQISEHIALIKEIEQNLVKKQEEDKKSGDLTITPLETNLLQLLKTGIQKETELKRIVMIKKASLCLEKLMLSKKAKEEAVLESLSSRNELSV